MNACVGINIRTGACSNTPAAKTGIKCPIKRTVATLNLLDVPQLPVLLAPVYPAFLGPPVTNLARLWTFLLPVFDPDLASPALPCMTLACYPTTFLPAPPDSCV